MGIYDISWCDDTSFFTASADNTVKKWSLESDAAIKTLSQGNEKAEIPKQIVAMAHVGDDCVTAVNVQGDILHWAADEALTVQERHKDYIETIVPHKKQLWLTSENDVFTINDDKTMHRVPSTHNNKVDVIAANSWAVFTTGHDKALLRFEDSKEVQKATVGTKIISMTANETHIYTLAAHSQFEILDAKDLSVKKSHKFPFDATCLDVSGKNLWVGDKKGTVRVLDIETLEEKHKHEEIHTKAVNVIGASDKFVATGDQHRYIQVFDAETFEKQFHTSDHKDKISDLWLTEEKLVSVTKDRAFGVSSFAEKKMLHEQKLPHDTKEIQQAVVLDGKILTQGRDCCVRYWSL